MSVTALARRHVRGAIASSFRSINNSSHGAFTREACWQHRGLSAAVLLHSRAQYGSRAPHRQAGSIAGPSSRPVSSQGLASNTVRAQFSSLSASLAAQQRDASGQGSRPASSVSEPSPPLASVPGPGSGTAATAAAETGASSAEAAAAAAAMTPPTETTSAAFQSPASAVPQSWVSRNVVRPLVAPLLAYDRAQRRRPYVVQVLSAMTIWMLGDLLSQYLFAGAGADAKSNSPASDSSLAPDQPSFFGAHYRPERTVRAALIGGISAIPSYHWFLFLGTHFNVPGSHALSLAYKIVINQFFYGPLFGSYFFGMQSLFTFQGRWPIWAELSDPAARLKAAAARIQDTVPTAWVNSFKFWPFVMAVNYSFIPPRFRAIFAGGAAVAWQTYLSLLNLRQSRKEARAAVAIA